MLIINSILAGNILSFLEAKKRDVSLSELQDYLKQPQHYIQAGIERLMNEGLAITDAASGKIKLAKNSIKSTHDGYLRRILRRKLAYE